ncbi:MAG: ATPase, T2SS/T4P/T4SS family [Halobacteria archaeon]|nr:ATPase, T2SS/T4P/T4SS family [Halobacteria archaeon]
MDGKGDKNRDGEEDDDGGRDIDSQTSDGNRDDEPDLGSGSQTDENGSDEDEDTSAFGVDETDPTDLIPDDIDDKVEERMGISRDEPDEADDQVDTETDSSVNRRDVLNSADVGMDVDPDSLDEVDEMDVVVQDEDNDEEPQLMSDMPTDVKNESIEPEKMLDDVREFFASEEMSDAFSEEEISSLLNAAKSNIAEFEGLEGYEEYERYWVNKPYAYISILYNDDENDFRYHISEPELDAFERTVREDIKQRLRDVLMHEETDRSEDKEEVIERRTRKIIDTYGIDIDDDSLSKILYYLKRDYIHDGKIDPIMRDPNIEDISCDGVGVPVFVYHRDYRDLMTNVEYEKDELDSFVIKLAQRSGKHISVANPMVDASMPDGSRIQLTLGDEITSHGSTFTIRKFNEVPFTPIDLLNWDTFSLEEMAYLWICIENNKSLIFAGGTASGKTTSMNAVSLFIPPKSKVVSIEDTREITLPHTNWIPSVTRESFSEEGAGEINMYELLRAALRQRPEYLIVGEVRGEEALTLFQAMSTGHTTYSTMHADSVDAAIHRLENPPISVPRSMLKALDIVSIQAQTFVGGKRVRRNMKLVEIIGIDPKTQNIRTNDIFQWDAETDSFMRTGKSSALEEIKRSRGWSDEELEHQIDMRREVLEYLVDNDITDYREVSRTIQTFMTDPEKIIERIREGELDVESLEERASVDV